jgi:hypothetical protein
MCAPASATATPCIQPGPHAKSEPEPAVAGYFIGKKFESYKAMQSRVLSLVHDTHPAATEFLQDAVVRDSLADHNAFRR